MAKCSLSGAGGACRAVGAPSPSHWRSAAPTSGPSSPMPRAWRPSPVRPGHCVAHPPPPGRGEPGKPPLGDPPTEAASRHVQASMFFARAGLAREAAQSEEHAFHAVRHAVEAGIAPSSASFAGEREWQFATVTVAAPPRIDLGGGWSDTPPFCLDWGGTVLNIALELDGRYPIQARVTRLAEPVFRCLADGAGTAEFGSMDEVLTTCPPGSPFAVPRAALQLSGIVRAGESLRAALQRRGGGLEVRTSVDLPMGSGLGTSSILAAAVVAAPAKMAGTDLTGYGLSDVVTQLEQTDRKSV